MHFSSNKSILGEHKRCRNYHNYFKLLMGSVYGQAQFMSCWSISCRCGTYWSAAFPEIANSLWCTSHRVQTTLPFSQRSPVQPGWQTHRPVCPSHWPSFSHTHLSWQPDPNRPAGHSGTTGIHDALCCDFTWNICDFLLYFSLSHWGLMNLHVIGHV